MKYYLIVGEASGDLHASRLMRALAQRDPEASFRFYGGDCMCEVGGTLVQHYKDLAYMGFIPVLMHLKTILRNMRRCREDILEWRPDVLILVDYPGFNLSIARYIKRHSDIPVYYYISPKIWAWKEHRIKNIRRDVDKVLSILPFEVDFYRMHDYEIDYVGNPTMDEVTEYCAQHTFDDDAFRRSNHLSSKPILALLAGSRKQEIKDNLLIMVRAASHYADTYQLVVAGAPSIDRAFYQGLLEKMPVKVIYQQTYDLLMHSEAALVTSGTATLETALFRVPQVVCYYAPCGWLIRLLRKWLLKVKYISLVNLIADDEVVKELVADDMNYHTLRRELSYIIEGGERREEVLRGYDTVAARLGCNPAADTAAGIICESIRKK
jgi:lipid-A-disaccharide synthase